MMASGYSVDVGEAGTGEREVETRRIVSKAGSHYVLVRSTPLQSESEGEWESDSHVSSTGSVEVKGESAEAKGESSQVKGYNAGVQRETIVEKDPSMGLTGAAAEELTEANASEAHVSMDLNQVDKDVQEAVHDSVGALGQLEDAGGGAVGVADEEKDIQKAIYASFQIVDRSQLPSTQYMLEGDMQTRPLVIDDSLQGMGGAVGDGLSEVVGGAEEPVLTRSSGDASASERDSRAPLVGSSCSAGPHPGSPERRESLYTDQGDRSGSGVVCDIDVVSDCQGEGAREDDEVEVMSCSSSSEGEGEPQRKRQRVSDGVDEHCLEQPSSEHTAMAEAEEARNEMDQEHLQFIHDIGEVRVVRLLCCVQ